MRYFKNIKKGLRSIVIASVIGLSSCYPSPNTKPKPEPKINYKQKIKQIKTVKQAMDYCKYYLEYCDDTKQYGKECWVSFKKIHKSAKDDCDGGAVAALALLSDDDYAATIVTMYSKVDGHAVFLYEEDDKYGSIGINDCDCIDAKFDSVNDLVKHLSAEFHTSADKKSTRYIGNKFIYYYILDFSDFTKKLIHSDVHLDPIIDYVKSKSKINFVEY